MLNKLSFKQKNIGLLLLTLVFGYLIYQKAIQGTLTLARDCSDLEQQLLLASSTPDELQALEIELASMNRVVGSGLSVEEAHQQLLEQLSQFCDTSMLHLKDFPEPHTFAASDYSIVTSAAEVEGRFDNLVALIHELEQHSRGFKSHFRETLQTNRQSTKKKPSYMRRSTFKTFVKHSCYPALAFLCALPGLYGCEDVFEPDLTNQNLVLLSPPNSTNVEDLTVQFIWEELEDADEYQLQVVRPDFAYIERFELDTTIADHMFSVQLSPNSYQWRVRGRNGSSETEWFTWNITIDSVSSLSGQTLVLLSPADAFTSNSAQVTFEWDALTIADDYEFELRDENGNLLLNPIVTTHDTMTLGLDEANYQWHVRARNSTSNTLFFSRTLVIDTTAPGAPILSSPATNTTTPDAPITFSWTRPADAGANPTTITDSLFVHADTLLDAVFNYQVATTSVTDSIGPGTWYWRVGSNDEAGNLSDYSSWNTLILQ